MSGRTIFEGVNLTTQEPQAVNALAAYLNKPVQDGVLDLGDVKLVRSNRGDAFYVVSAKSCSCPSAFYNHGGPCKHQRKHFGIKSESKPVPEMKRGGFRPVMPEDEPKAFSSPIAEMLIDAYAPTTTLGEIEYWQQKAKMEA